VQSVTHSPRKTIQLTTFGSLAIGEGADASRRSRRALALLALTAAGGPNGAERAGIVALLWPDSDAERAANSFRQILHGIRRDLGDGAIVYEGGCLKLNPSVFSVDLWDFEHAVRTDDMEAVARIYCGPFLGTFNISGLLEFERWVEGQRERLRQVALVTLRRLAAQASAQGDYSDAVRRWRAVVDLDPLSSKSAVGLLRALSDAGDRTGALEFARVYETLVRTELETEPDQIVVDFVTLLRRGSGEGPAVGRVELHAVVYSSTTEHTCGCCCGLALVRRRPPNRRQFLIYRSSI
jgi:DNA-binding SARP family transcriptional activator